MTMPTAPPLGRIITFYSYKGGIGRTMALANVAWILASNGHRVLAIDWDLESPGLHRYFHPFLVDKQLRESPGVIDMIRAYASAATRPVDTADAPDLDLEDLAQIQRYASSLDYPFPDGGGIDLVPAGRQEPAYSGTVLTFNWDDFYRRLEGGAFLVALREDLRRHYDYVLLDSRTGLSDNAGICTVLLPDVVVDCFALSNQSIEGAVAIAHSIRRQRSDPPKLLPVPMRVEDGELGKLDRSRTYARQRFEPVIRPLGLPDSDRYWGSVEIPYKVFYAYEEVLAAFGDRARQENSLLAAYERLTGVLTGAPCALPPMPEQVRLRWVAEFERRSPTAAISLTISYAARDRMWAEWIAAELTAVGQPSVLAEVRHSLEAIDDADRMLVLLTQDYLRAKEANRVLRRGSEREVPGPGTFLIPVRLDGSRLPRKVPTAEAVDLTGVSAAHARAALLAVLELPDVAAEPILPAEDSSRPRFPASPPAVWRVSPRNPAFTGRDAILEALRERLLARTTAVPSALLGLGGVGKSQIALEYAHRFAADYDIVWWISADQPGLVRTELARLAEALRLPVHESIAQVEAVREALRQGVPSRRWLIIFDNADDPDELRPFLPEGPGDVIVTSRNPAWLQVADSEEIAVFDRQESVDLMARRVATVTSEDAGVVAERLGDLPLLVEQAAAWLATTAMPARQYVELLDTRLADVLGDKPPPAYPDSAAATWGLAMDRLREQRPAAARLLELCACFAPDPIPIWLLATPRVVDELIRYERSLRDPLLHASLVRDIGRYALARVDSAQNAVRVHRLVQTVIKGAMSPDTRLETQVQVQEILAAAAATTQGGPDDQDNWERYESMRPHLEPVGALESRDDAVRQLVLDMVRYLSHRGDLAGSQELAERAVKQWSKMFGDDDLLTLRLRVRLANTLRDRGRFRESHQIGQDVLPRLSRVAGPEHPYTLEAMSGLGGDLWFLGEFQRAREICEQALERWRHVFDDDHPRTMGAANNLALAYRLFGDYEKAQEIDYDTRRRRRRALGERHLHTLYSEDSYGRDLRAVGDYQASRAQLDRALEVARTALGPDHQQTLRLAKNLAVTLRRLGELAGAHELVTDTLARSERVLGSQHPETAACLLELACTLSARGDHTGARSRSDEASEQFTSIYGERHPVTLAVVNDVAVFLLRAGDFAAARPILENADAEFGDLEDRLGQDHPYALVTQLNLATVRYASGDPAEARRLDERTYSRLYGRYRAEHPLALVAAANLAVSLRDTGAAQDARTQTEETLRTMREVLGEHQPDTRAAREGQRISLDIEPPPM
jgi:tetratricopeptide (TPR) repeat protein